MGYSERDWYRQEPADGGAAVHSPIDRSFRIFRVFGIAVDVHLIFILFVAVELVRAALEAGVSGLKLTGAWLLCLWVSILLHEFGHCLGARRVGGRADRVLLWPLGGLAYTQPPHRPGAHLLTTAAGPAVNLLLCSVCAAALYLRHGSWLVVPWHPLRVFTPVQPTESLAEGLLAGYLGPDTWLLLMFGINYLLFLFNALLPVYPLDGGRLFQELLWFRLGYDRSLYIATGVGMVGAAALGIFSLMVREFMLIGVAVFGYFTCMQQRQLLAAGASAASVWGGSASREPLDEPEPELRVHRPGFWQRRREAREQREELEADRILEKIHREGIDSLTRRERRILRRATERRREQGEA